MHRTGNGNGRGGGGRIKSIGKKKHSGREFQRGERVAKTSKSIRKTVPFLFRQKRFVFTTRNQRTGLRLEKKKKTKGKE